MALKTTAEQRARWRLADEYDALHEAHDFYPGGARALLDDVETLLGALRLALESTGHGKKKRSVSDTGAHCDSWIVGDEDYCNCWRSDCIPLLQPLTPEEPGEG